MCEEFNEFAEEYYPDLLCALQKGFMVDVILSEDTLQKNESLIRGLFTGYSGKITFYVTKESRRDHSMLIGGRHLYLEVPHLPDAPCIEALGIEDVYAWLKEKFLKSFSATKSEAIKIISDVEGL